MTMLKKIIGIQGLLILLQGCLAVQHGHSIKHKTSFFNDHVAHLLNFRKICASISLCALAPLQVSASIEPTDTDNRLVQMAFRDFDAKRFDASDTEFSLSINRWKELERPRDEIVSLLKARASVRLDSKRFKEALADDNEALNLMKIDGENSDGTAKYPEYPDTFVSRALANEGLAEWGSALDDYNKAIDLWGGGRGDGINPYVLTFRGNTLCRLGRYEEALPDYRAAADLFIGMRDVPRFSDARANLALALYELGKREEAVKAMKDVIRKNPGYADMHVALAADNWSNGDYINALKEWKFTCESIDVGCEKYQDRDWLLTVRRWPPSLVKRLDQFLAREIPEKLKGEAGAALAPPSPSSS